MKSNELNNLEPNDLDEKSNNQLKSSSTKLSCAQKCKIHLKQNLILVLTLAGIIGGIVVGFVGRTYEPSPSTIILIGFPGELLLRLLKMLILPLIISSLITGLAQLDPKSSGKMGSMAIGFYVLSTFLATATGCIMALIMHPGRQKLAVSPTANKIQRETIKTSDAILDIIRNMFPDNIVQACSQQISTHYKRVKINQTIPSVNATAPAVFHEVEVLINELKYNDGTNVMGLVVFCTLFGIFISKYKTEAQVIYDFFFALNELIMKIVALIMWYSPVGILFLVAANIIRIDNMADTAKRLSLYMITVILGLIFHSMVSIQLIYFLATKKNPFIFLKGMLQAWLTAVGTASSSATLPITFRCLEENNKVDKRVTRFMLPLGATINMDGTALYQCVATLFIAQLNGIDFGLGQIITVCLASTATSIGVASVPSAALVTMLIVLSTVGLPTEHVSFIIAVDWLLDRLRTSINVLGDAYGCGIVAHLSRNELKKIDDEAEQETEKLLAHRSHELSPSHTKPFLNGGAEKSDHPYQSSASHNEENPSLIGMNSYSRNSPKIPLSVTSMPQISVFQSPSFENQDSTV